MLHILLSEDLLHILYRKHHFLLSYFWNIQTRERESSPGNVTRARGPNMLDTSEDRHVS